jgi:TPR repeat protein
LVWESLLKGVGTDRNSSEAAKYLKLSADGNNKLAQYLYGKLSLAANGIEKNCTEAVRYLRLSAGQGQGEAQCLYRKCLLDGIEIAWDYATAVFQAF